MAGRHLLRGRTNFIKMLWRFDSVYDPDLLLADHRRPVAYRMDLPPPPETKADARGLYVHAPRARRPRPLDRETRRFVEQSRLATS